MGNERFETARSVTKYGNLPPFEWNPAETAPHDGQEIVGLATCPYHLKQVVVAWRDGVWREAITGRIVHIAGWAPGTFGFS